MGAAYAYAEECVSDPAHASPPPEIITGFLITRFGAEAVFGGLMTAEEMLRIARSEWIVNAHAARQRAADREGGMAKWAQDHPDSNLILEYAREAYLDEMDDEE